jgi:predicted transposase YdaD
MADHDKTHKLFFNHRRLVHDFFVGYLPREWTERMDFATLEPVQASLIGKDLSERHGDRIWRVRWYPEDSESRQGDWFYFYLLLEFQSSPSPFMPLRLHNYVGHVLEDLVRQPKLVPGRRLPPVVAMVSYDGLRPWTGPLDLGSLFVPVPESVRRHLPQLRPLFVDESRSAPVADADNLAALFFQVNTNRSPEALPRLAQALDARLPVEEEPELRQDFARLILRMLRRSFPGATIPEVASLEEIPMVGQHMTEWYKQTMSEARSEAWSEGRSEGRREGRSAGRKEGEVEGMRRLLLEQLRLRFGSLPLPVRRRIKALQSAAELRALAGKVLVASSLEEMGLA